jgi:ribonuclease T1
VAPVRSRRTVAIVIAAALVVLIAVVFLVTRGGGHGATASSGGGSKTSGPLAVPATLAPLSAAPVPVSSATRASAGSTTPDVVSGRNATTVVARPQTTTVSITAPAGVGTIAASSLPSQARDTLALIAAGGPYPYKQDGVVWENREGRLPKQQRGYYHEYTVVTPGSPDRGARRIISGADGAHYYTADHYGSFKLVIDQ